jgi:hypothetical protein
MKELILNQAIIDRLLEYSDHDDHDGLYFQTSKNYVLSHLNKKVELPFHIEIEGKVLPSYYDYFDGAETTVVLFCEDGSVCVLVCRHVSSNNAEYDDLNEEAEEHWYSSVENFINNIEEDEEEEDYE